MTTLTEFLLARITEDEAAVRRAVGFPFEATWDSYRRPYEPMPDQPLSEQTGYHLGTDPARVLARCAADRAIVELHGNPDHPCPDTVPGFIHTGGPGPCSTMRALRRVYADHPDYDEGWRP